MTAGTMGVETDTMTGAPPDAAEERALAELIVRTLNLEISPEEIDPEAPLYEEGLGLDSIDILEIALAVSQAYDVKLKADDEDNIRIFRSLRSLNRHIQHHRPQRPA
jgi:acyl carrier protein